MECGEWGVKTMTNDQCPMTKVRVVRRQPAAFRFPLSAFRFSRSLPTRRLRRRGLAPLELVLWLPILMMVAALIVKSMDLVTLRWLVVVVVLYAAALLLRSAFFGGKPAAQAAPANG